MILTSNCRIDDAIKKDEKKKSLILIYTLQKLLAILFWCNYTNVFIGEEVRSCFERKEIRTYII